MKYVAGITKAALFSLLIMGLVGCSSTGDMDTSEDFIPEITDVVAGNSGDILNKKTLLEFIENTKNGTTDEIRVVNYTKEGDPILHDVVFNGREITVTMDNTIDEYGSPEILTFTCKNNTEIKSEHGDTQYLLNECEGYTTPYELAVEF